VKDIKLSVNREGDKITGFTLVGVGESYAEAFCISFLKAQSLGKAQVTFDGLNMNFVHGGVSLEEAGEEASFWEMSEGGTFTAVVSEEEAIALAALLEGRGEYKDHQIRVRLELAFQKGFTLYTVPA